MQDTFMEETRKYNPDNGYDNVGNAEHYDVHRMNILPKLEAIYGTHAVMLFCEMNAEKYFYRLGSKKNGNESLDLMKAKWYRTAAKLFWKKIRDGKTIKGLSWGRVDLQLDIENEKYR